MRVNRVMRHRPRYADVAATLALLLATTGTAYAAGAFPAHSVGAKQLKKHAVTKSKVAAGVITSSKLGSNSVTGAKIANGSVTLADIAGTDVTGSVSLPSIPATSCLATSLSVSGAVVGQVAYLSWVGSTPPPNSVVTAPMKVTAPGMVTTRFCNVSAAPTGAVTNVGVRVITLG
jgi:hypothetical protein